MTRYPQASVHGRFQPFHNGHLEYVTAALARTDFLIVGITQHMVRRLVQVPSPDAVHRAAPHSNPLSYYERAQMIDAVLNDLSVSRARYTITPFPIEEPDQLSDFLPTSVPVFTTTYDRWNEAKITTLRQHGYHVDNLWTRDRKEYEGRVVWQLIEKGDSSWKGLVPGAVISLIEQYDVAGRLRALSSRGG